MIRLLKQWRWADYGWFCYLSGYAVRGRKFSLWTRSSPSPLHMSFHLKSRLMSENMRMWPPKSIKARQATGGLWARWMTWIILSFRIIFKVDDASEVIHNLMAQHGLCQVLTSLTCYSSTQLSLWLDMTCRQDQLQVDIETPDRPR